MTSFIITPIGIATVAIAVVVFIVVCGLIIYWCIIFHRNKKAKKVCALSLYLCVDDKGMPSRS